VGFSLPAGRQVWFVSFAHPKEMNTRGGHSRKLHSVVLQPNGHNTSLSLGEGRGEVWGENGEEMGNFKQLNH